MMPIDYQPADRQTQASPRSVFAAGIGCIFLEYGMDMLARNAASRVANINAIGVRGVLL
jgi:hypothetical protein